MQYFHGLSRPRRRLSNHYLATCHRRARASSLQEAQRLVIWHMIRYSSIQSDNQCPRVRAKRTMKVALRTSAFPSTVFWLILQRHVFLLFLLSRFTWSAQSEVVTWINYTLSIPEFSLIRFESSALLVFETSCLQDVSRTWRQISALFRNVISHTTRVNGA